MISDHNLILTAAFHYSHNPVHLFQNIVFCDTFIL